MPGLEKLLLEDTLEDTPQMRNLVGVFEHDAVLLQKYTLGLQQCSHRVLNAQRELAAATHSLSSHLKAYEKQAFPLEHEDSILISTLRQFSTYLDELSSIHQVLVAQLGDGMMYPLNKFLQADLDQITTMSSMYKHHGKEHELAMERYMKLPKKKETEKTRKEANEDLTVYRKKFHQTALHYYSSLNAMQYKRKASLLEPFIGYMHGIRTFFAMGKETVDRTEVDNFMANITASIQGVRGELGEETQRTVTLIEAIEQQSQHLYQGDRGPDMPYIPPNPTLNQKAGYLFSRSKQSIIGSKWERSYFFIQGGNLMCQAKREVAGSLVLDLNEGGVHAEPVEIDDRRFSFQVISPVAKKTVILQAENERERDEWILTIFNVVKDGCYVKDKSKPKEPSPSESTGAQAKASPAITVPDVKEIISQQTSGRSGPPPAPPNSLSNSGFLPAAPIQFDIISPSEEVKQILSGGKAGPPTRINPFDQSADNIVSQKPTDNSAFFQTFPVRFVGSMGVTVDRGEQLVHDTIGQIMAARALHNVFKTREFQLVVCSEAVRLVDLSNNSISTEFSLEDISYWTTHKENPRLFGFITRTKGAREGGQPSFACHVFEGNNSGDEVCLAIATATKLAYQVLMDKDAIDKEKMKEKEILLANIQQLDETDQPILSPDGQYIILSDQPENGPTPPSPSAAPEKEGEQDEVKEDVESEA